MNNVTVCLCSLIILSVWAGCESARILAFLPFPAKSHQRVVQPLLRELAVRGHHVTYVTPIPLDDPPDNYTLIQVPDYMKQFKESIRSGQGSEKEWFIKLKNPVVKIFAVFWKILGLEFVKWTCNNENVRRLIDSDLQFDLIILETTFLQEPLIALGHKFQAPVVEFLPSGNMHWSYWLHGNPIDTNYIEDPSLPYSDHMTFSERLFNTFLSVWTRFIGVHFFIPKMQAIMDEHIRYPGWEKRPDIMTMISETSLILSNTHFSVNYPYPVSPNLKEVGGLNIGQPKPLPKDLQLFMDSATDGVIYFTLGSHIEVSDILGDELRVVFSKVFGSLKQKVLWKWETEFIDPPSNVKISKWFPQQDILAHKNCILFITHGGLLSTTEAVYQGIPTVGIPLLPDQDKNVVHMVYNGYGVLLQPYNLTEDSLRWAINEILDNPRYRENAKKRSELFRDKPNTALETAVYWTEYVIRHKGAEHLRPAIASMPWYQQAMIDVYAALAAIILIPLYILYKLTRCLFRILSRCGSSKKESSKKKQKKQ